MIEVFWEALKSMDVADEGAVQAAAERIKELPRREDGVFDLSDVDKNMYRAAALVYPVYTRYETTMNKKEGYPDIMAQMRAMEQRVDKDFTPENAVDYLDMLISTISVISPEIYENYRELVDMFRGKVKKTIREFGLDEEKIHGGMENHENGLKLAQVMKKACGQDVLLTEKYEALIAALQN